MHSAHPRHKHIYLNSRAKAGKHTLTQSSVQTNATHTHKHTRSKSASKEIAPWQPNRNCLYGMFRRLNESLKTTQHECTVVAVLH